jgi:hypothetical protein
MLNFGQERPESRYNPYMARGWESKSVEAQIEGKEKAFVVPIPMKTRTPGQIQHIMEKRTLELARAKVAHELASSQNPRYTQMLQRSLSELDKKIAAID